MVEKIKTENFQAWVRFGLGFVAFAATVWGASANVGSIKITANTAFDLADKNSLMIEKNKETIHSLRIIDKELEMKYSEILRRLEKSEINDQRMLEKLDNLVRVE